jgi:hypothetical protein
LIKYLITTKHADKRLNVQSFKLSSGSMNTHEIDEKIQTEYQNKEFMLMVGTIEPRKGYLQTFKEFEILWEKGIAITLVIVGKYGANADLIAQEVNRLIKLNYPLQVFSGINDAELNTLYYYSKAVICSSIAEGYGLPLAESMLYKKPIFANRLQVFGEFAGSYPVYFDIHKTNDLASKIESFDSFEWFDSAPQTPSWKETAEEISSHIINVFDLSKYSTIKLSKLAVQWAYRLYFDKDVDENTIAMWLERCSTLEDLMDNLRYIKINSKEVSKETVQWAYRLYFGKDVDEDGLNYWLGENDINRMLENFLYEIKK